VLSNGYRGDVGLQGGYGPTPLADAGVDYVQLLASGNFQLHNVQLRPEEVPTYLEFSSTCDVLTAKAAHLGGLGEVLLSYRNHLQTTILGHWPTLSQVKLERADFTKLLNAIKGRISDTWTSLLLNINKDFTGTTVGPLLAHPQ
jgi:hypothetical protein